MTSITKNADGTVTRTYNNGSSITFKNGKPTTTASGSSTSSVSSSSGNSSTSSKSTTQTSSKTSTNSVSSTSPSTSSQSITSSSSQPSVYTAQPTYVSGGNGGNTYLITREDGSTNQIAASGISLAETSKYYADKAAQAEAKGDLKSAQKYAQSASDFAAAANYESNSGITNTYGKSTGITYDATAAISPNNSSYTGLTVGDTAVKYQAGHGLTESSSAETLAPMEVSSILGGTVKKENSSTSSNSSNSLTESSGAGSPTASAPEAPSNFDMFMTMGSDLVNAFGNLPDTLMNSGTLAGAVGGFAATALLPNDLVKTIKKASDGNADEITGWDIAYSAADVLGLIPFVGLPFKAAKAAVKGTKVAGALSGGLTLGTSITETITTDGDNDSPVMNLNQYPQVTLFNGETLEVKGTNTIPESELTWMIPKDGIISYKSNSTPTAENSSGDKPIGVDYGGVPYSSETPSIENNQPIIETPTQNPTTPQNHTQPEQNTEYDLSSLQDSITKLFAGAGGSSGTVVGGGGNPMMPYYIAGESGGGSGDVTVVTNGAQPAQPVDYSGVFQYIVPVAVIIGIIIVAVALIGKNKKKGGASA